MASYNKVLLMGNLTRDPESRYTSGGAAVCTIGMACNRRYVTAQGEEREEVTFVDVDIWGKQGESVQGYLRKGNPVFIEGRLRLDSWEDKATGQKRNRLRVQAERVHFIGGPSRDRSFTDGGEPAQAPPSSSPRPAAARRPAPEPMPAVEMPPPEMAGGEPEPPPAAVDDIPF